MKIVVVFDSPGPANEFAVALRNVSINPSPLNLAALQSTLPNIVSVDEEEKKAN